jgi:hypothetical protein
VPGGSHLQIHQLSAPVHAQDALSPAARRNVALKGTEVLPALAVARQEPVKTLWTERDDGERAAFRLHQRESYELAAGIHASAPPAELLAQVLIRRVGVMLPSQHA